MSFSRFVLTPENRSALAAAQQVADAFGTDRRHQAPNPLYVHGAAGTGKTYLVSALVAEVTGHCRTLAVTVIQARDFEALARSREAQGREAVDELEAVRDSDLLVVEDLQELCSRSKGPPPGATEALVQLFDHLYVRQRQLVFTAPVGPGQLLLLPGRLTTRLASGLVVSLEPLRPDSRLRLLEDKAQRRQLALSREVLSWLGEHLRGGIRQLEGALAQLQSWSRTQRRPLDLATVAGLFRDQAEESRPTVQRIAERVGRYFQVEPRRLESRRRHQNVVLPRHVSMYLARLLTDLSLNQIGSYFGGRDHSTVLHACRKIEQALAQDTVLSGAINQLQAELR